MLRVEAGVSQGVREHMGGREGQGRGTVCVRVPDYRRCERERQGQVDEAAARGPRQVRLAANVVVYDIFRVVKCACVRTRSV